MSLSRILCVDLDGTFIKTDMLYESFFYSFFEYSSKYFVFERNSAYRDLIEIFYLYRVTFLWNNYCGKFIDFKFSQLQFLELENCLSLQLGLLIFWKGCSIDFL